MGLRLSGSNALAYQGVQAPQPPNLLIMQRNPTATDAISVTQGTFWLNWNKSKPRASSLWQLVDNQINANSNQKVFTWLPIGGPESSSTNVIVYNTPGSYTYTPTAHMSYVTVECVGGGGGGVGSNEGGTGSGSGGGAYCKKSFSSADITTPQSVIVGVGGAGGIATTDPINTLFPGSDGQNTTFGSFMTAGGGQAENIITPYTGLGGIATGGDININGQSGSLGIALETDPTGGIVPVLYITGSGGNSGMYGSGGRSISFIQYSVPPVNLQGYSGNGYGSGAGGFLSVALDGIIPENTNGGNGTGGIVIITEYLS